MFIGTRQSFVTLVAENPTSAVRVNRSPLHTRDDVGLFGCTVGEAQAFLLSSECFRSVDQGF